MKFALSLVVAAFAAGAGVSAAGTLALSMQNGNDGGGPFNTTLFAITNTSAAASLQSLSVTVGDTQYLFDQLYLTEETFSGGDGTQFAQLLVGDRTNDGLGLDTFAYSFTNFAPGITFRGQWDIDNDNGDFNADTRAVFFNNGAAPNATITATFSDGSAFVYQFPDLPVLDTYTLAIPSPGATGLAALGLIFIAWGSRRRPR